MHTVGVRVRVRVGGRVGTMAGVWRGLGEQCREGGGGAAWMGGRWIW